jgi:hypothetical protein
LNPGVAARSFADYAVTFDGQSVPIGQQGVPVAPGVQINRFA